MLQNIINNKNFYLIVLTIFAIFFIFSDLGENIMPPFDDCYYAQQAKEIIQTGNWLTIHYAGKVSLDSAPLYVWLIAIMFKFFGINEFSALFFSAFFGVATIISVYFLGKMLFDEWIGLFSSFVMLTTSLFFVYSRRAMVDVTFTFWFTVALFFFMKGMKKRGYFLLFGVSTGMAILTKSILGLFPILIAILYLFLLQEFNKIKDPLFLLGLIMALLISFPWYFYQYITYPELFVKSQNWLIVSRIHKPQGGKSPIWYLKKLLIYYWPWIPLATYSLLKLSANNFRKIDPNSLIILCWAVTVIGVMSCMSVKLIHYTMSVLPALAILTAISLNSILGKEKKKIFFSKVCFILLFLSAIIIMTTPITLPAKLSDKKFFDELTEDTWSTAIFAKKNIPRAEKTLLYRIWPGRIRNTFLFYSDRKIFSAYVDNKDLFIKILTEQKIKYSITTKEGFAELSTIKDLELQVIKETPLLVFFSAAINKKAAE